MMIDTREVMKGARDGEVLWICHYNRPDLSKKPLRSVAPVKVLVRPLSDLPKGKKVYYSESFFSPLGNNGKPLSRVISPVDNTGYRSYCGNTLFVFDDEEECKNEWNRQLKECMGRLDVLIESAAQHWRDEKSILQQATAL